MTEIAMARESESQSLGARTREALDCLGTGEFGDMQLDPDPIYEKWILSGNPVARSKTLALGPDGASKAVIWDCTSGSFYWHYRQDEAVLFLSGDTYLLEENGKEQRFAGGDFAFFPAGTVAKWRVDGYVRKIAFLHEPVSSFALPALRFWNKLMRKFGLTRQTAWTRIRLKH
jgi:uncharacterized protein